MSFPAVEMHGENPFDDQVFEGPEFIDPNGEKHKIIYSRLRDEATEKDYRLKALEMAAYTESRKVTLSEERKQDVWMDVLDIADKYLRFINGEPEHDLHALFPEFYKESPAKEAS